MVRKHLGQGLYDAMTALLGGAAGGVMYNALGNRYSVSIPLMIFLLLVLGTLFAVTRSKIDGN